MLITSRRRRRPASADGDRDRAHSRRGRTALLALTIGLVAASSLTLAADPAEAAPTVAVADSGLLVGQHARLHGDLGSVRRTVRLQRYSSGTWRTVANGWTTRVGLFSLQDPSSRTGTYRVLAPAGTFSGRRHRAYASAGRAVAWQTVVSATTTLSAGLGMYSPSRRYLAFMQHDGNFVVYDRSSSPMKALWSTGTNSSSPTRMVLQADGNLVAYTGSVARWSSATAPGTGVSLRMQDDGNLVIYSKGRIALWSWKGGRTRNTSESLQSDAGMSAGQALYSRNGRFRAAMQGDGNFVVYGPSGATWASRTGVAGSSVILQSDGNLVVYAPGGVAKWSSATAFARDVRLVMQDDGNLVMYSKGGLPLWSSGSGRTGYSANTLPTTGRLQVGQAIWSNDNRFMAIMQGDGNFVVYGPNGAMWASGTGVSGSTVTMQSDGNLVVYAPGAVPKWASSTSGSNARLVMQDDGNLVIYSGSTPLWSSYGNGAPGAGGGTGGYPDADAVDCRATYGIYSWCKNGSWYHPVRRFAYRNCTDYVAWRKGMVWGDIQYGGSGHAYQWKAGWEARGRTVSTTPKVGAVAWWPATSGNTYGHVAYVISVNGDGSAHVGEYNRGGTGTYGERDVRAPWYLY